MLPQAATRSCVAALAIPQWMWAPWAGRGGDLRYWAQGLGGRALAALSVECSTLLLAAGIQLSAVCRPSSMHCTPYAAWGHLCRLCGACSTHRQGAPHSPLQRQGLPLASPPGCPPRLPVTSTSAPCSNSPQLLAIIRHLCACSTSARSTGSMSMRRWSAPTCTTLTSGRPPATQPTTRRTCSALTWRSRSLG